MVNVMLHTSEKIGGRLVVWKRRSVLAASFTVEMNDVHTPHSTAPI